MARGGEGLKAPSLAAAGMKEQHSINRSAWVTKFRGVRKSTRTARGGGRRKVPSLAAAGMRSAMAGKEKCIPHTEALGFLVNSPAKSPRLFGRGLFLLVLEI